MLCDCGDQRTAALGLLENIQREDLNPFEQAQGLRDVIALWDCTQAEAAKRLGMAQPTLANLKQAVFPDALSQPRQLFFIKNCPSLKRRGMDAFHRQGVDLSGRFLPFKHDSFPFR